MPRAFSTRRFTFAYALIVAVLVALGANLVNYFHLQRQVRIHHQRFESLQHLMLTAYRGLPADQFTPWLARVDFQAWETPGWNLAWLRPDQTVTAAEILGRIGGGDCSPRLVRVPPWHRARALGRFAAFILIRGITRLRR